MFICCQKMIERMIGEAVVAKVDLSSYPNWQKVKWCCQVDMDSLIHESDLQL